MSSSTAAIRITSNVSSTRTSTGVNTGVRERISSFVIITQDTARIAALPGAPETVRFHGSSGSADHAFGEVQVPRMGDKPG